MLSNHRRILSLFRAPSVIGAIQTFTSTRAGLCLILLALLAPPHVAAQAAYLDGDNVYLPVVEDYEHTYSLQLRMLRGTFPIEFVLVRTRPAEGPVTATSAWYEGNVLVVPEVWIKGLSYWAELRELSNERFELLGYGPNETTSQPGPGGYQHEDWEWMPGEASDIGIGADGTVWAVGASTWGDDYGLFQWDGHSWWESRGSAVRVDVDPQGKPWIINADNEIYRLRHGYWEHIPGEATDIGIGADGSVWVTAANSRRGGHSIYTLDRFGWKRIEGAAEKIDVAPDGTPWVINDEEQIYRLEQGLWRRMPGKARDIGIGADGSVWVIGMDYRAGGYGIYRFNGTDWDRVPGSGTQISVGPGGEPWVVNRDGDIFRSWGRY